MEFDKDQYAELLSNKLHKAIKLLKILIVAAMVLFAVTALYGILAVTIISDKRAVIIGFIVDICFLVVMALTIMAVLLYAYVILHKLKKLK